MSIYRFAGQLIKISHNYLKLTPVYLLKGILFV